MDKGQELSAFLVKREHLFSNYLSITEKMKESISRGEVDRVGVLISRREEVAQKIEKVNSCLQKLVVGSVAAAGTVSEKLRGAAEKEARRLGGILEQIVLVEKDVVARMEKETESLKEELLRMRRVRSGASSYKKSELHAPRFWDSTS